MTDNTSLPYTEAMVHLVFIIYLLTLCCGSASIGVSIVIYLRHRKASLRFFLFFLVSLLCFLAAFLVNHYGILVPAVNKDIVSIVQRIFQIAGTLLFISISPFFFFSLTGRTLSKKLYPVVGLINFVVIVLIAVNIVVPQDRISAFGSIVMLFGMIAFGLFFSFINLKKIGEKRLRRAILVFGVLSAFFLPLFVMDMLMSYVSAFKIFSSMNNLSQPLYFFILSVLSIIFCVSYFNEPVYRKQGAFTHHFKTKFGISDRECEIIAELLEGEGSKSIGEKLFISSKTVENHIYNIFKKCDVRNRLQLHQLVSSNTAE